MKDRVVYCNIQWDSEKGKKSCYFSEKGGKWGDIKRSDANAMAYKTGNGLVVVDVDTQDLDEIDKRVGNELKKLTPTVTTKRGYHYYFWHKNSAEFVNDSAYTELVDVRSDGGLIFAQYRGRDKQHISYKKTGKIYNKIPKKLYKLLLKLRQVKTHTKKTRDSWSQAPKGEIHSATLSYAGKDFHKGLSFDEVMLRGVEYVEKYLGGTPREMKLMSRRIKDAYEYWKETRLKEAVEVSGDVKDIGGDFEDDEILGILISAQKKGALELEKTMKLLKEKTKLSLGAMRDMLREASKDVSINGFFKGEIVWDDDLGVFAEVRESGIKYHKKGNFVQTVMSKSGYMVSKDVNDKLPLIPNKRVLYRPDIYNNYIKDEFEDDAINSYRGVNFDKECKKIPKLINKLLDNLFLSEPTAKENFIQWLAYIVQYKKMTKVAWGFFGVSGSGKGLIVDIIMRILGHQNCSINVGDVSLQSSFNEYAFSKLFIHLNEIASDYHSRNGVAGKLKAMITDDYIQINMKGVSAINCKNYANIILNSNKPNPIELDIGDRRWNMIVTNKPLKEYKWFTVGLTGDKMISKWRKFGEYLAHIKVDKKIATKVLNSATKKSVIEQTTNPLAIIGSLIKNSEYKKITEYLQLSKNEFIISEDELKKSCETKLWANTTLKNIYTIVTNKDNVNTISVVKYFIRPYLTSKKSFATNGIRYYKL